MSAAPAVEVQGLWKRYGLPIPIPALARRIATRLTGRDHSALSWALQDVSLQVAPGESFGILGENGAGKSTLLKVLAGASPPTHGGVVIRGRVFPMIELNAGVHDDFTGRENTYLLGAFMGLRRAEIRRRLGAIQEFAELGAWFDRPFWQYSSGMRARLGFSVAMNVDADVLLIDEVLAVGDQAFKRKCFTRLAELQRGGVSILLVSHSLRQLERLCDRAVHLRGGRVEEVGATGELITSYTRHATRGELERSRRGETGQTLDPSQPLSVVRVELIGRGGEPTTQFETGEPLTIRLHYRAREPIPRAIVGLGISNDQLVYVTGFTSDLETDRPTLEGEGVIECHVPKLLLLSGVYSLGTRIRAESTEVVCTGKNLIYFEVVTPVSLRLAHDQGYFMTEVEWRSPAADAEA